MSLNWWNCFETLFAHRRSLIFGRVRFVSFSSYKGVLVNIGVSQAWGVSGNIRSPTSNTITNMYKVVFNMLINNLIKYVIQQCERIKWGVQKWKELFFFTSHFFSHIFPGGICKSPFAVVQITVLQRGIPL